MRWQRDRKRGISHNQLFWSEQEAWHVGLVIERIFDNYLLGWSSSLNRRGGLLVLLMYLIQTTFYQLGISAFFLRHVLLYSEIEVGFAVRKGSEGGGTGVSMRS